MDNKILIFKYGKNFYGLDIFEVVEIMEAKKVIKTPNLSKITKGILDIRGKISTILNISNILEIPEEQENNFIVCEVDTLDNLIIIPCTDILEIYTLTSKDKVSVSNTQNFLSDNVKDVINYKDNLVVILCLKNLVANLA